MKRHVLPDDAKIITDPDNTGDTQRVYGDDDLDVKRKHGGLGEWELDEDEITTTGFVELQMPIVFVENHQHVLVPRGAFLHYGPEGFFVWSAEFHNDVMHERGETPADDA